VNIEKTTGASLLLALEQSGALTRTSLTLPEGVSEDECENIMGMFKNVGDMKNFAQGDLLIYVKDHYGDDAYVRLIETWGLNFHSMENKMSLCRNVRPSVRRVELSFGHHDVVRGLLPNDQRHYLKLAIDNRWTRQQLRDEVHGPPVLPPAVKGNLTSVARDVLAGAKPMMDGYLISRDSYQRLRAALGEE
jgi:hypothetical protein